MCHPLCAVNRGRLLGSSEWRPDEYDVVAVTIANCNVEGFIDTKAKFLLKLQQIDGESSYFPIIYRREITKHRTACDIKFESKDYKMDFIKENAYDKLYGS